MKSQMKNTKYIVVLSLLLLFTLAGSGCGSSDSGDTTNPNDEVNDDSNSGSSGSNTNNYDSISDDSDEMFTDRDLEQTADTSEAEYIELNSDEEVTITEEGVFVISGNVENATVVVDTDDEAKVQLVLDGVSVTNEDSPVIYVKQADKVFLTTTYSDNTMKVSGTFTPDGDTNLDAVIYSKDDLVLNGTGSLEIVSSQGNGISSKDDLKITGGSLVITSALDSIEANDSICINDGELTINSGKDALHSENEDDDSVGFIYIAGGTLKISAADDGIQGTSYVQINGGIIDIETSTEGIEGTFIQINNGDINIYATDDGINASKGSSAYSVVIEVNGGTIYVKVGSGDTDGFDSNGDIYINGGTIDVEANSAFDFNGVGELNDGTVTVNGEIITELTESMMNPGGGGGGRH